MIKAVVFDVDVVVVECVKNLRIPKYFGTNQDHLRTKHLTELVGMHFDGKLNLKQEELMLVDDDVLVARMIDLVGCLNLKSMLGQKILDLISFAIRCRVEDLKSQAGAKGLMDMAVLGLVDRILMCLNNAPGVVAS